MISETNNLQIKRLNVYTPVGSRPSRNFMKKLREAVGQKITVCEVDGEVPAICEVGFNLHPHAKLEIHNQLIKDLDRSGFWAHALEFFGLGKR